MDCLEKKEFLQWNTRTKDHLCANFQDIWLSSNSWILDIKYAISTIKMQILNQFFLQKDSLYCCYKCAKFSSTCKIIFIFSCMLSLVLWNNFLWMTLYHHVCIFDSLLLVALFITIMINLFIQLNPRRQFFKGLAIYLPMNGIF